MVKSEVVFKVSRKCTRRLLPSPQTAANGTVRIWVTSSAFVSYVSTTIFVRVDSTCLKFYFYQHTFVTCISPILNLFRKQFRVFNFGNQIFELYIVSGAPFYFMIETGCLVLYGWLMVGRAKTGCSYYTHGRARHIRMNTC